MYLNVRKKVLLCALSLGFAATANAANSSVCGGYGNTLFGDHVCVFDASQSQGNINDIAGNINTKMQDDQFGSNGYALLFKPGNYSGTNVEVGYYTQVAGLGLNPNDTTIGSVQVTHLRDHTSLDTFWRSAENFTVPGNDTWAVSQASPMRNVNIKGNLWLAQKDPNAPDPYHPYGFASGGFLANVTVSNTVQSITQQQWLSRNSNVSQWSNGVWNQVFVGVKGAPYQDSWDQVPYTVVDRTPSIQEKPYLAFVNGSFEIVVPKYNNDEEGSRGASDLSNGAAIIPQSQFVIVKPGMSASDINKAIQDKAGQVCAVIFTPGQYDLRDTININQANTVVFGLGVPVLTALSPHKSIMQVSASGVKVAGIVFEAGSNDRIKGNDPSLLRIGVKEQDHGNVNDPTTLSDVYCRVGGRVEAQTQSCITVNDSYTILDNLWLWRADHGKGAGNWDHDAAQTGLIVNGDDVTAYGLAVEHFRGNQVIWNGDHGRVYFYQSELPYDVPENFAVPASFKIADQVDNFNGYGFGVYSVFRNKVPSNIYSQSAIEAPDHTGVELQHMVDVNININKSTDETIKNVVHTNDNKNFGPDGYAFASRATLDQWSGGKLPTPPVDIQVAMSTGGSYVSVDGRTITSHHSPVTLKVNDATKFIVSNGVVFTGEQLRTKQGLNRQIVITGYSNNTYYINTP